MSTGDTVKKLRIKNNLTQESLAHAVGYTDKSSITRIEKGKQDIPQSKIPLFCRVLKCSPGELLGIAEPSASKQTEEVTFDDFSFALYNETKALTKQQKKELLNMARYMKTALEKEKRGDR